METPEAYLSLSGKIPDFPKKISTMRKYNISTTIVLQSLAQLKMMYKDDYETIIGNCDSSILLGTQEQTSAEYFSKQLGKGTIRARNTGLKGGKGGGTSFNFQQTGRELMTMDEIRAMDNNRCIVFVRTVAAFYDWKYPLEQHPRFKMTADYDKSLRFNLMEAKEFYNFTSEVINEVKMDEPEDVPISTSVDPVDLIGKFFIKDEDDEDTIKYINDTIRSLKESFYKEKSQNVRAVIRNSVDYRFAPMFLVRMLRRFNGTVALALLGPEDKHIIYFAGEDVELLKDYLVQTVHDFSLEKEYEDATVFSVIAQNDDDVNNIFKDWRNGMYKDNDYMKNITSKEADDLLGGLL